MDSTFQRDCGRCCGMGFLSKTWLRHFASIRIKPGVFVTSSLAITAGGGMLVTSGTESWGWATIAIGISLLIWGVRINGFHLWKPWWRGRPFPLDVTAGVFDFTYEKGAVASGIVWQPDFSHIWLNIENSSLSDVDDVDILIAPQHHIVASSVNSDFVDCRIGPSRPKPKVTAIAEVDGKRVAHEVGENAQGNYFLAPSHRLQCGKIAIGTKVCVSLATVDAEKFLDINNDMLHPKPNPEGVRLRVLWSENSWQYFVEIMLDLKQVNRD